MRPKPDIRFLAMLFLLAVSCSRKAEPAGLHQLREFAGRVTIQTKDGAATLACELSFARSNGNFQVQFRGAESSVTLLRDADGKATAFEDAVARPPTPAEQRDLDVVYALSDASQVEQVRTTEDGYEVLRQGRWYEVRLESAADAGAIHGTR